ncbi:sulfotransferase domain-containing protein [Fictibacillus phosphorivorans]|uniref:sulfotransferase domain-containing protein n=1 Tax=Fictibacillus phosphorivorans TaxID=1221500 RepID=UPI00203AD571|nr:sulfotransferase domain-containing protein [Fictibacillus phosphorivorans]MCM3719147.1 sulfotransferase domain-containing protein [Fictibacillus phosphorivorans]MCM3776769.1 sulfotransferase domain-containing protein [Fictibacillus phosphorivorans]
MRKRDFIKLKESDLVAVAYPKSGNNFLLFLLGMLLYRKKMDWSNKASMVQNIVGDIVPNLPSPRLVWSHEGYDPQYPKVIFLVRDPRDVVISYYFHLIKYYYKGDKSKLSFDTFFNRFMDGKYGPGQWNSYVEGWIDNQKNIKNGLLLVRYEDLLKDTGKEVERILEFLELKRSQKEIEDAIQWASFDNMRALEQKQKMYLNGTKNVDEKMPFVRSGKVNGWKSFLSDEQQKRMEKEFNKALRKLGYL